MRHLPVYQFHDSEIHLFGIKGIDFMNAKRRLEELLVKINLKQGHQDLFAWPNDIDKEPCPTSLKTDEKGVKRSF